MFTRLRNRKERAYGVNLELEPRIVHLPSSPHAVAWDPAGRRLLFQRADWVYTVIKGTEEVFDPGVLRTVICEAAEADLPLDSVAAGQVLAVLAVDELDSSPDYVGDVRVECLAVEPDTGNTVVFWHRDSSADPYPSSASVFSPTGSSLGSHTTSQPNDGTPRWAVPHAIVVESSVYAIERDGHFWDSPGPATGRVVKRGVGAIGTLSSAWSPDDRWTFPHSLALNPESGSLYVLATRLWNAGLPSAFERSYLILLDSADLSYRGQVELHFNIEDEGPYPYFMGGWQAAGDANTGGKFFREAGGAFISCAENPTAYSPDPLEPTDRNLFRWTAAGGGQVLDALGGVVPWPIFQVTATDSQATAAVLGNFFAELPVTQEV